MPGFVRRAVLGGLAGTAAGIAGLGLGTRASAEAVKWSSGTEPARTPAPPDATDCHHHVYDGRFPIAPSATLKPGDATVADYRALQKRIGTSRHVVVQPSTYGTDNRLLVEALGQFGPEARGVAVVDTNVTDAELKALHAAGVRGIRFNLVQSGATTVDMIEPLSKRVEPLGWHVQIHMLGDGIVQIKDLLARLPSQIVFDHLGRIPEPAGANHPAFAVIRGLLDKGRTWMKLSGAYIDTKAGPPGYADTSALARAFAAANPERVVWGSDWPHPTEPGTKPDDAVLFDLLAQWVPDQTARTRVLVRNPAELYGFGRM